MATIEQTVLRYKRFYQSGEPGDILVVTEFPAPPWSDREFPKAHVLHAIDFRTENVALARAQVRYMRWWMQNRRIEDDWVPGLNIDYGHGVRIALLSGSDVVFSNFTSWSKPVLKTWDDFGKLKFDEDSFWLQKIVESNEVWKGMDLEGDIFVMPFFHCSPMDYAWGLRGEDIFTDIYEHPGELRMLLDFCVKGILWFEKIISRHAVSGSMGRAIWGTWVPEGTIFVNGDPADLVSADLYREFGLEYDNRAFTGTGGGFFHHHSIGLHQVRNIAGINNLHVQNITIDPNTKSLTEMLQTDKQSRDNLIKASLVKPIHFLNIKPEEVVRNMDVLKEGRFILRVDCADKEAAESIVRKVRQASNFQ